MRGDDLKKINIWKLLSIFLLLISISWGGYNYFENWQAGRYAKQVISELEKTPKSEVVVQDYQPIYTGKEMPTQKIGDYYYLGELRIASLNLKLPVINQWDYERLKLAPSLYQGSYYEHNMIIAGHNYQSHFGPLLYINEGAVVEFINIEGEVFQYQVIDTQELEPTEISVLVSGETEEWDLTLFTCTNSTLARQIIRCKQIF